MSDEFGLISVIMAAYNSEKTIEGAISSVLEQTYANIELIIVNDFSKDSTCEIVERYTKSDSRVKLINNKTNLGVSATRHHGVKAAKGNWLAFLDSDDIWNTEKLQKQIEIQKKTKAEFLFTGSSFMGEDGEKLNWILHVPSTITYKDILKQNLISNSSVLIKKNLFLQYEVIGDRMHEDFACWIKILKSGKVAYGVDEPLLIYRLSANSKSGNKLKAARMNWNTYRYLKMNIFETVYYMIWYTINGLRKYSNIRQCNLRIES